MEGVEQSNDVNSKILLQPNDVTLRPMKHLHLLRIRKHLIQLLHPPPHLRHQQVHDKISPSPRRDLHETQEAAVGAEGMVFQIHGDFLDGWGGEVREEGAELGGGGDVGDGGWEWEGLGGCGWDVEDV